METIYLDNSATTKPYDSVIKAMVEVMENNYGNPSSLHTMGISAERAVKAAREQVAKPLKALPSDIYFTSGGTESNNIALLGAYNALRIKGEVITTKIEHKSVLQPLKNVERLKLADVDKNGLVDMNQLESMINENTSLVSIIHVNNESGAIQPIEKISRLIKNKNPNCLFHVDAVQSYCKIEFPRDTADLITVSAHKIHGPKGVGAIYIKRGVKILPLVFGGGQEKNLRSGTENTPAIVGFGVAASVGNDISYIEKLNKIMSSRLENVVVNSIDGSAYILNISAEGIRSEILLHSLEERGVFVSSGSACTSKRQSPSHVLTAMGLSREIIDSSIRISFSMLNTEDEIIKASDIINEVVLKLRKQMGRK